MIGQQFCPFAAQPYEEEEVLLELVPQDQAEALGVVYKRAAQMAAASLPATSLMVSPDGLREFSVFLAFLEAAELLIEEAFPDRFVTASFHPDYTFAGLPADDAGHWVHRSPYAVLQLLRREQVAFAKKHVDIPGLLLRNSTVAAELGAAFFRKG